MRIIAVANQKGGCGKTTTAINLSACLARLGKKTLLVDLDPQGHSTLGLGYQGENFEKSLYDVLSPLREQVSLDEVILRLNENHHLVPSHVILSAIEQQLAGVYGREEKLMEKLRTVRDRYHFVLIDCPPNLGLLTFNALRACQELLIPLEPSSFSLQGLGKIRDTVSLIGETLHHRISLHAFLTQFNRRSRFHQEILTQLEKDFKGKLLKTRIHQNVRLREAVSRGKSICDFDEESTGFRDYLDLAHEVIRFRKSAKSTMTEIQKPENRADSLEEKDKVRQEIMESFQIPSVVSEPPPDELKTISESVNQASGELEPSTSVKPGSRFPVILKEGVIIGYYNTKAKSVQVAGDFNNWVNEPLDLCAEEECLWKKQIALAPGKYRYKFIVDGEWMVDPLNEISEANPYGGIDSVVQILSVSEEILNERRPTV